MVKEFRRKTAHRPRTCHARRQSPDYNVGPATQRVFRRDFNLALIFAVLERWLTHTTFEELLSFINYWSTHYSPSFV